MTILINAFMIACGALLGLVVAVAAVIGFLVLAQVTKEWFDERRQRVWKNEPPAHPPYR